MGTYAIATKDSEGERPMCIKRVRVSYAVRDLPRLVTEQKNEPE